MWSSPSTLLYPLPPSLSSACSTCVCVCYMHFAQILSFPFRLDSNKNNVNKSYNNYNKKLFCRQRFVCCCCYCCCWSKTRSTLLWGCLRCCRVYPTNANRQWQQQQQQPQPVRRAIHVRPPVCLSGRAKMPSGWAAAATREEGGGGGLCIALHEGKGGCGKLKELGIGTGLLLLGGRNWLPAVLNYKRSLFSDFVCNTFIFFFLFRHELPFCCCCCSAS